MSNLTSREIKAFVPAKDFALSKRFYLDLGFEIPWFSEELAYVRHDNASFLLQAFYVKDHAENVMMHLLVEDADAWWAHIQANDLPARYASRTEPPSDKPWGMHDFVIIDPAGVLWRIAHNL